MKPILYLILCVFVTVCRANDPQSVREIFKDDVRLDMLYHPDRVEVCIWHPKHSSNKREPGFSLEAYDAGKYVLLPQGEAALVTWKLTTDEDYIWNASVDGEHILHARVRYSKGKHTLTADINFSGGIVIYSLDDERFSDGLLGSGSDWVFQIVERTFPKDKVVQAVQKHRELMRSVRLDFEIMKATEAKNKREFNKAPEPITPAADAPVAPASAAAHL